MAKALQSDATDYWAMGCTECSGKSIYGRRNTMPTLPFKPVGAILFKTSRKLKSMNSLSRPVMRPDLELAVVRSVAPTTIRHTTAVISSGANVRKKWARRIVLKEQAEPRGTPGFAHATGWAGASSGIAQ